MNWSPGIGTSVIPYNRKPTTQQGRRVTTVAPHGDTSWFSYTVPAGRKFLLLVARVQLYRSTAGAPNAFAQAYIGLTPSGGLQTNIVNAVLNTNTITAQDRETAPAGIIMSAGDALTLNTNDSSTGGSISYDCHILGIEFDA